jgi:polyhydroxyalkanoate synthesis regulator phasin
MNTAIKVFIFYLVYSVNIFAEDAHSTMNHQQHMMKTTGSALKEAGNDIFSTIQEVIDKLNNDPDTDWGKVDIEALRQHLLDMNDMAMNVEVVNQKPLKNGLEVTVLPITERAEKTLAKVFNVHPIHLKRETGWSMQVVRNNKQFIITTTTEDPKQVKKIIALSYIGLMAYGKHHQPHHWGISTSQNPHGKHH